MDNTRPTRIFVDAHCFDTIYQGTQTFLHGLYQHLLLHHPDLDIYFGAYYTDRIARAFPMLDRSKILPYRVKSPSLARYVTDIPALLRRYQFDFAHFQYIAPRPQRGCRYIVTIHDLVFNDFPASFSSFYRHSRNLLFRKSIHAAAIKTTVSDYSRRRIADLYKVPVEALHLIPNGVMPVFAGEQEKEAARIWLRERYGVENFVLCTSRIEPRKNHLALLDAWLNLKLYEKRVPLVFIGERSMGMPALLKRITGMTPLQQAYFHWLPQVSREDLNRFYLAARLFVYPSLAEGFGIPPLEAAVACTPVLCSNTTAMAGYDFFAPHHFNPAACGALERHLESALNTPPEPEVLNAIAAAVVQRYSWEKGAEVLYRLFTENTMACR